MRLGRERRLQQEALREEVGELQDYAPLLGRRSLAGRLANVTRQAKKAVALDLELRQGLASYQHDLTSVLQLPKDWWDQARQGYLAVDGSLGEVVELVRQAN